MKEAKKTISVNTPAYAIHIHKHPDNLYSGEFLVDGKSVFNTGIPNSFAYVFARLEPWFAQAPHTKVD